MTVLVGQDDGKANGAIPVFRLNFCLTLSSADWVIAMTA